jgi:4-hydroxy-3-methylbut-2-enyl diphosphate reductase
MFLPWPLELGAQGVFFPVRADAESRGLRVFDATCSLATKVHVEVAKIQREGRELIMIGPAGIPRSKAAWVRRKAVFTSLKR